MLLTHLQAGRWLTLTYPTHHRKRRKGGRTARQRSLHWACSSMEFQCTRAQFADFRRGLYKFSPHCIRSTAFRGGQPCVSLGGVGREYIAEWLFLLCFLFVAFSLSPSLNLPLLVLCVFFSLQSIQPLTIIAGCVEVSPASFSDQHYYFETTTYHRHSADTMHLVLTGATGLVGSAVLRMYNSTSLPSSLRNTTNTSLFPPYRTHAHHPLRNTHLHPLPPPRPPSRRPLQSARHNPQRLHDLPPLRTRPTQRRRRSRLGTRNQRDAGF